MADYIDREDIKYEQWAVGPYNGPLKIVRKTTIDSIPSADVAPVVRCCDCKYYRVYSGRDMCARNAILLDGHEVGLCATGKDDFCSYGERKNDE